MADARLSQVLAGRSNGQGTTELRSLTGLRGLAAALLLLYHLTPPTSANRFLEAAFRHGYLFVDLFFVLSGFVMALVHQDMVRAPFSGRRFVSFLGQRVARIYPLYLVSSVAALALFVRQNMRGFEGQLLHAPLLRTELANLLMVQNWGLSGSINGAAWSISAEWSAYVLFPLFSWAAFRTRPWPRACILAGILLCLAALVQFPDLPLWHDTTQRQGPLDRVSFLSVAPLLRCWTEFCLGMFSFQAFAPARRMAPPLRMLAGAGAAAVLAAAFCHPGTDLIVVLLYVPLVVLVAPPAGGAARLLGNPLFHRMGLYSYSFYMLFLFGVACRGAITRALSRVIGPPGFGMVFAATLVLVFAAAALSFHLLERPARRFLRARIRLPEGAGS